MLKIEENVPINLQQRGFSWYSIGRCQLQLSTQCYRHSSEFFVTQVLKPLYAPLIDGTKTKKFWLITTMSGLGATCWLTGSFITKDQTFNLSVALLLLNFLSAAQDIAVDSLAVRILSDDQEIGIGNTIQVVAYKAGSVFAG